MHRSPAHRLVSPPALAGAALGLLLLPLVACGPSGDGGQATPAPAGEPVVNRALGLVLDDPATAGFRLDVNQGETLRLVRPAQGEFGEAVLTFELITPLANPDLVAAVNQQKADIEARPGGTFLGQVQLGSQIGTAFSTRGRYTGDDGAEVEEIRLFAVHPGGEKVLALTYRYNPVAGNTKTRTEEVMGALGLVQPRLPDGAGEATDEGAADEEAATLAEPGG